MGGIIAGIMGLVNTGMSVAAEVKKEQLARAKQQYATKFDNFVNKDIPYNINRDARMKLAPDNPYSNQSVLNDLNNNVLPAGYTADDLNRLGYATEVKAMHDRMQASIDDKINQLNDLLKEVKEKFHQRKVTKYDSLLDSVINEKDKAEYIARLDHLLKQVNLTINQEELDKQMAQQKDAREQAIKTGALQLLSQEDTANSTWLNNLKYFNN